MRYLTARKRAAGKGSAHHGAEHHWSMQVSAVGLALGLDDVEALAAPRAFLQATWIVRQLFGLSGNLRFRALAVVGLIP